MMDKEFLDKILPLIDVIKKTIESEKENGPIPSEIESLTRWETSSLNYDDSGLHLSMRGNPISKYSNHFASIKIVEIIKKTPEYQHLIDFLKINTHIEENPINLVNFFIARTISKYLDNEADFESSTNELIFPLIADLRDKSSKVRAIVEFYGIILHENEIYLSPETVLRKPKKEDFEKDVPSSIINFFDHPHFPEPTAFLELNLQAKNPSDIEAEITKAVAILQLFRPISIKWNIYRQYSESYKQVFQRNENPLEKHPLLDNYIMKGQEVDHFRDFCERVYPIIPPLFYRKHSGKVDHSLIAFNRYSDSLLQNDIIERRIANSIMGLEALYFKPSGELQELQYRLGIRIAKILGILSFNSIKVRCTIRDAYTIRSIFSHGGHLSYKEKRKYEAKYGGDIKNLLNLVLDYLRVSILVSMTIHSEKDEFIDTIDNALIDNSTDQRLIGILNQAKSIVDISKK